jgi:uncharacterized membrane protein YfcA
MQVAVPVGCLLALCLNVMLICRLRVHVRVRVLVLLLGAAVPGMILGTLVLGAVPSAPLQALLGLALLLFVWREWRPVTARPPAGPSLGVAAGLLSGLFGALIGVNGPPVVVWVARQGYDRNAFRGTLTAYFLLVGLGLVASQALGGLVTMRVLTLTGIGLPALVVGVLAGLAGCGRIGEKAFRRVLLVLLGATGLSLLLQFWLGHA